jgi:hypothetical protein
MRPVIADLIIAVLIVSAIAGTILFDNKGTYDKSLININPQTTTSNDQSVAQEATPPTELSAILNETVVKNNLVLVTIPPETPVYNIQYDSLWINGSVTNEGQTSAINAGLHVEAYAADGSIKINMTIPIANAVYGTDSQTIAFISHFPDYALTLNGIVIGDYAPSGSLPLGHTGSPELGSLDSGQTVSVTLAIYHEGTVSNWTVTPVWTNTQ